MHLPLRGMSRDRLDLLGEEYFNYVVRPRLRPEGLQRLRQLQQTGRPVVLVSQELDHLIRPLAQELKVEHLLTNRLEFRDGRATGRLLNPVVGSLGGAGRLVAGRTRRNCRLGKHPLYSFPQDGRSASPNGVIFPAARQHSVPKHAVVDFGSQPLRIEQSLCSQGPGREKAARHRDDRFHWQSLADDVARRPAGDRPNLSVDSAPGLAFCAAAL